MTETKKIILNAGSGARMAGRLPAIFNEQEWTEVRLDISPANEPDIVGSIVDMRAQVGDAAVDVLYSSHAIEHLYAHEVIPAFREFRRVLKPGGVAIVTCPSLLAICRFILAEGAEAIAYDSPAGAIRPIDMLYGHSEFIANGATAMAHRTGFTGQRLGRVAMNAGFSEVRVIEGGCFDIWGLLLTPETSWDWLKQLLTGSPLEPLLTLDQAAKAQEAARAAEEPAQPNPA
ncbi:SAM-dependent methyltransferase [Rhodoblastus acidophilus]|uniref:class I SAM-dependent methyltransferase n=1 Tax=Rhodoblastus acidophilus TaxID=1074 RepID=UPI002224AF78|nr:class I SAM-dependent methyltransferase [Rhodoblastus acidophilus]MCW2286615.1 SAM-dependent methyltransferase [Rhodoblastus acidophilus]MCW2335473.1 SAM-dependent methyltransferase [Rhodoblastus acidophilus]